MSNKQSKQTPSPSSWESFLNLCPSRYLRLSEYYHIHDALESNFQMPKRKLPFTSLLTTAGVKDGDDLLGRQVSSHLAIYRSKSIAQNPLGCQQAGIGTLKKIVCVLCLAKLCLDKKDQGHVPGMSGFVLAKLKLYLTKRHIHIEIATTVPNQLTMLMN